MKPISPLKVFKALRGFHVNFYIGLPRFLCIKIARWYMFSKYYRNYIREANISYALENCLNERKGGDDGGNG